MHCNIDRDLGIFVAGHKGLAGSAVLRRFVRAGCSRLLIADRRDLDLRNWSAVHDWFSDNRPDVVVLCAARVGGILANSRYPTEFLLDNLRIQNAVMSAAHANGVSRLIFLGSSCIYPRDCTQPISEDALLTGPLEATNQAYAIAKIAGIELCWALNRQFDRRYLALMPTNLFGPGDNYNLETSHVLPALIRKMHEAKVTGIDVVTLWGTGAPRREFLFSDDLADAIFHLLNIPEKDLAEIFDEGRPPLLNIGTGEDLAIRELAQCVAHITGFHGRIEWDKTKPDGTPRKLLDVGRVKKLGWSAKTGLEEGIRHAYRTFLDGTSI